MVGLVDLGLRPSGKRSTPLMEEKTVLLQSTPGSEVIEDHLSRTSMVDKPEGPLPSMAQNVSPSPLGGEGGEKTHKGRVALARFLSNLLREIGVG